MALLRTLPNPYSAVSPIENAYCVVDDLAIDKQGKTAFFGIKAFLSCDDRKCGSQPFYREGFFVDGDTYIKFKDLVDTGGSPVFTHAYTILKQSVLDEDGNETNPWANAKDA